MSDLLDTSIMGSYYRYSGNYWVASYLMWSSSYSGFELLQGRTASTSSSNLSPYVKLAKATKVTIIVDRPITKKFYVNETSKDISGSYVATTTYLRDPVILGADYLGTKTGSRYTFYSLKAYNNQNEIVSEIVPAIRNEDGMVGLFDIFTSTFVAPDNAQLEAGPSI